MSVDLPAPFSPHRPSTSPALRSMWTSDSAFTPGNVLDIPRNSSRFVTSHPFVSDTAVCPSHSIPPKIVNVDDFKPGFTAIGVRDTAQMRSGPHQHDERTVM